MTDEVLELLCRELELSRARRRTSSTAPLDLSGLWALYALDRPELKDPPWTPQTQPVLTRTDPPPDLFRVLQAGDVLVHHPYDSFTTSVEAFVDQARRDPHVLAIKQTLYRTAGPESAIVAVADRGGRGGQAGRGARRAARRASTSRPTSSAPASWRKPACTSCTGSSGSRPTRRSCSSCARSTTGSGATATSAPATTTRRPRASTRTSGSCSADPELGADLTELFNYLTGYSRQGRVPQAARRAADACAPGSARAHRAGDRQGRRRPHHDEDEQPRRSRRSSTRCTPRRRRAAHRPASCAASAACGPACPGCPRTSACARSSAGSSSTRGSTASAPIPTRPST